MPNDRNEVSYYPEIQRYIEEQLKSNFRLTRCVDMRMPDLLTPLIIVGNGRGALIGAVNPTVYSRLVSRDATNPYKILVRNITEEDLRNA